MSSASPWVYLALVIREVVAGGGDCCRAPLAQGAEWLKFAAPITVLVFAQAGLYRRRDLGLARAGSSPASSWSRSWSSRSASARASTSRRRPHPVVCVVSALTIGLLPAAIESATLEVVRAAASGAASSSSAPARASRGSASSLESARSGLTYVSSAIVAPEAVPGFHCSGAPPARRGARRVSTRRGDPLGGRLKGAESSRGLGTGPSPGDQGAARPRRHGAPRAARRVRPGSGRTAI